MGLEILMQNRIPQRRLQRSPFTANRQQRQSQSQAEIEQMRASWQAWEQQAQKQAVAQRKIAERNGWKRMEAGGFTFVPDEFTEPTEWQEDRPPQRQRRKSNARLSDKEIDEMRYEVEAAAKRAQQKDSTVARRQRLYKGVDELDPSGRLGRKVQRLSDLTQGLQQARQSRNVPNAEELEYTDDSYVQERLNRQQNVREASAPSQDGREAYDWPRQASAAFQSLEVPQSRLHPDDYFRDPIGPTSQPERNPDAQPLNLEANRRGASQNYQRDFPDSANRSQNEALAAGRENFASQQTDPRFYQQQEEAPESFMEASRGYWDGFNGFSRPEYNTNSATRRPAFSEEESQGGKLEEQGLASSERFSNSEIDQNYAKNGSDPMPPPPAPLGAPGTKISKKEQNRMFWAAMRGEVPATDMFREKY